MLQCSTASVKLLREHKNQYLKDAIMMITFDQISASSSANLNTVKGLSTKTYVGFGKRLELNLASVRDLMNGIFTHIERLLAAHAESMIVVDEAQDTADEQWQSVRHLSAGTQLMCLADLDQQTGGDLYWF